MLIFLTQNKFPPLNAGNSRVLFQMLRYLFSRVRVSDYVEFVFTRLGLRNQGMLLINITRAPRTQ